MTNSDIASVNNSPTKGGRCFRYGGQLRPPYLLRQKKTIKKSETKKYMTNIKTLVALFLAGAAFTACSSSEESIIEQPVNPTEPKTYTMTVQATKGGASRE